MTDRTLSFEIEGTPASKGNRRRLVKIRGVSRSVKSPEAQLYARLFTAQCPVIHPLLSGPIRLEATIYSPSRRSDLDESLIMDGLQGLVIENDRQIIEKIIVKRLDPANPRSIITITELDGDLEDHDA